MANPVIGEVPLEIGGRRFRFVLGFYGLAALERRKELPWPKIFAKALDGSWGYDDILAIFHAGLMRHHEGISERDAADLLDQCGIEYITQKIGEGVQRSLPQDDGGSEPANPTKPNGGIGIGSIPIG